MPTPDADLMDATKPDPPVSQRPLIAREHTGKPTRPIYRNALAQTLDAARNAAIVADMRTGAPPRPVAARHGISVLAVRAIWGSHLAGIHPPQVTHETLATGKQESSAIRKRAYAAALPMLDAARRAQAQACRDTAPPGAPGALLRRRLSAAYARWLARRNAHSR